MWSALLGPGISFSSVYLFHLIGLLYLLLISARAFTLRIKTQNLILALSLAAILASSFLHGNIILIGRYSFYLLNVFLILHFFLNFAIDQRVVSKVQEVFSMLTKVNIIVGLLETLYILRWPVSPYSPFAQFFSEKQLSAVDNFGNELMFSLPTSFYWNPNNFLFVTLLFFPFLKTRNFLTRFIWILAVAFLVWATGSRGAFLGLCVLMYLETRNRAPLFGLFLVFLVTLFFMASGLNLSFLGRAGQVFQTLLDGVKLFSSGDIVPSSSTTTRAFLYVTALEALSTHFPIGLGYGGTENLLISIDAPIQSLHFFLLQLLVDIPIFFIPIAFLFLRLLVRLSKTKRDDSAARILSCWLIFLPTSISPSDLTYSLPFWCLCGFTLYYLKVMKNNENSIHR